jgi:tetratricopeptide (TPR) repeat protein
MLAQLASKILQHFEQKLQQPWQTWRDLRLRLKLSEPDLQVLFDISYYQALAHTEIKDDHLDMMLRVSDTKLGTARNLFNSASQALNDIDQIVPEKITVAQNLIEIVTTELKEEDLDAKKSDVLRQSFTEYPKTILLNLVAKAYGNKLERIEKAMACFGAILEMYPESGCKDKLKNGDAPHYVKKIRSLCMNASEYKGPALYALGGLAAIQGNNTEALEMLRKAAYEDFYSIREWAQRDIAWESLRDTPEFKAILQGQPQS